MTLVSAAAAVAITAAMVLFLGGFARLADALAAEQICVVEIATGSVHILGATAIWVFTLCVVGGLV